jgi:hypothetical protein
LCRPVEQGAVIGTREEGVPAMNTGFVMEAETDVTSEVAGKPDIFVPKPCPNGCLPPQK